jgi:hypothetical protein
MVSGAMKNRLLLFEEKLSVMAVALSFLLSAATTAVAAFE